MKNIKNLFKLILCLSVLTSSPAFSNQFQDDAESVILALENRSRALVSHRVYNDISDALKYSMMKTVNAGLYGDKISDFHNSILNLEAQYERFLIDPANEYIVTNELVKKSLLEYLNIYNAQIELSWSPSQIATEKSTASSLVLLTLNNFKKICADGTFDPSVDNSVPLSTKLPAYDSEISAFVGIGDSTYSFISYRGLNYENDNEVIKVLNDAAGITFTTSAAVTGYGVAQGLVALTEGSAFMPAFSSALGGASTTALTVLPYAAVAVIIMSVVIDFSNKKKLERLKRQRVKAEFYKFNNTMRSQWMKNEYREECGEIIGFLEPIYKDLNFIESNKNYPENIRSYYSSDITKLKESYSNWELYSSAKCKIELSDLYNSKKCEILSNSNTKKSSNANCFVNEKSVYSRSCDLQIDSNYDLLIDVEKLNEIINKFSNDSVDDSNIKVNEKFLSNGINVLRYLFYQNFAKDYSMISERIFLDVGAQLDLKRKESFQRLLKLTAIYKKTSEEILDLDMKNDLNSLREFNILNSKFKELVALSIRVIFEKGSKYHLALQIHEFKDVFGVYRNNHLYLTDVSSLNLKLNKLISTMSLNAEDFR
jgi:hypothetical protein